MGNVFSPLQMFVQVAEPPKGRLKMGLWKNCAFAGSEKDVEAKHKHKKLIKQLLFSVLELVPSEVTSLVVLCLGTREAA